MQDDNLYPNMELICRLCLQENSGTVSIFSNHQEENAGRQTDLSIPMRIMACVALEVQANDGLPKKICPECRYQLEKTYLFRKQSQASDAKLRKHIRLLSLGKSSKVFRKNPDEDEEDGDELEFYDSLEFIKLHEDKIKQEERLKLERLKKNLKLENAMELKKAMESLKAMCKEELRAEVEQNVKEQLRQQIQREMEDQMLPKIRRDCVQEAKESLREELKQECRQTEMKTLLDDLQSYLKDKQKPQPIVQANRVVIAQKVQKIRPLSPAVDNKEPNTKRLCYIDTNKLDDGSTNTVNKLQNQDNQRTQTPTNMKPELALSDNPSDMDTNVNDDDGDSDNFYIYDTDEGFEVQKKSEEGDMDADVDEDTFVEDHIQEYDSSEDNLATITGDDVQKAQPISYRIEDTENGEIKFLKKSNENVPLCPSNDENNADELSDANIMIINYPSEMGDEEHLDMVEYDEDFGNKPVKSIVLKGQPIKRYKSTEFTNIANMSLPAADNFTTTTSTVETTLMTKTYINTTQRVTDTPKLFKCSDCPMAFSTKPSLERHLRTHRKVEETGITYQCSECKIVVSCASALRRHMFIHCAEKPFVCKECGKSFVQKEILKRHMQIHTGIKPHQCQHCGRAFAQRINLQQHINRHHMEEPRIQQHACHLCPKRFNHASGLSRHLASHSGVAFQCSECDRTFGDRSSIKRHIANKHGSAKLGKSEKQMENNHN